jgi:hypothetical protein
VNIDDLHAIIFKLQFVMPGFNSGWILSPRNGYCGAH